MSRVCWYDVIETPKIKMMKQIDLIIVQLNIDLSSIL